MPLSESAGNDPVPPHATPAQAPSRSLRAQPVRLKRVLIVIGAAVLILGGLKVVLGLRNRAAERERQQAAVADIAPVPLPTGPPLIGPDGQDADGYPMQRVDELALRSLLFHRRYQDLTAAFEAFQSAFEADRRKEYWPMDAGYAFSSAEPEQAARLDAWVAATPGSFAPYLARGAYWTSVAYHRRGDRYARETLRAQLRGMEDALVRAEADLDHALALRPGVVAAQGELISVYQARGEQRKEEAAVHGALAICPTCVQVQVVYLPAQVPQWGGSYERMAQLAAQGARPENPRTRLLPGYVALEQARVLFLHRDDRAALAAVQAACAFGDHWEFLAERAKIEAALHDDRAARADLDRAEALRPGVTAVLAERAAVHGRAKRWELAGTDLLGALRAEPTDDRALELHPWIVQGLIFDGWQTYQAGHADDALRKLDLAAELDPTNGEVRQRRTWIISPAAPTPDELAAKKARARQAPDDFRAHQALDYALARGGHYDQVVAKWNGYLARNPDDGRAHLERGGAYHQLGRSEEAVADMRTACALGISEGCALARSAGP